VSTAYRSSRCAALVGIRSITMASSFFYFLIVSFLCSGRLPQAPLDKRHPEPPPQITREIGLYRPHRSAGLFPGKEIPFVSMVSFLKEPTSVAITGSPKLWAFRAALAVPPEGGAISSRRSLRQLLQVFICFRVIFQFGRIRRVTR
jgi:hypothetical protein